MTAAATSTAPGSAGGAAVQAAAPAAVPAFPKGVIACGPDGPCKNPDFHVVKDGAIIGERDATLVVIARGPNAEDYSAMHHCKDLEVNTTGGTKVVTALDQCIAYIRMHRAVEKGFSYNIKNKNGEVV